MRRPQPGVAADVVIVGSGASGAVAAAHLAAAGFEVVCLEQGDWTGPADYMSDRPEAELAWIEKWSPDPNTRRGPADYPLTGEADVRPVMYNGVGGGLVQWAAMWQPLLASDFKARTLDGVADDWPINWSDLAEPYAQVAREMSVSGLGDDPALPELEPYPNPPIPIGRIGMAAARGMDRLGWHWWPGSNAIASRSHRSLQACQRRGTCMMGCPENAKATPSLTHWPSALAAGARLVTGARVAQIPIDERGRARGAVYLDRDGVEHLQPAQVVILAANAVGTARLLLLSASPRFPDGLANSSGLVGRRLMQHPYRTVTAVCEDFLDSWQGPWGQSIYSLEFAETHPDRDFVRGTKWMVMPHGGPMFAAAEYQEAHRHEGFDAVWGPAFHRAGAEVFGHAFTWGIQAEDLPEDANRVVLDPAVRDSSGLPAARIEYRVSDNTRRMLDFNVARAVEAAEAAGAASTMVRDIWPTGIGHVLGTTRMGDDPRCSVVDRWCRAHDVANLY
ncbi:MAG: GMC family oxidoreductase, partial [Acidimicrobiaceae bacterium]|nr:GMC family oxidoreductase [Acidimicrobiaceae bacterium]MYA86245.1 GMC family oxidoreductase [Acidimicrobiaceae bacterium]